MKKGLIVLLMLVFMTLGAMSAMAADFTNADEYIQIDDANDGGTSVCNFEVGETNIDGENVFAATMTGNVTTTFMYGYIQFKIEPNAADLARLQNARGIKFKVRGDGKKYRLRVETSMVADYDYHGFNFTATDDVQEFTVPWNNLRQEGWGNTVGFMKKKITALQFTTMGQPHSSIELQVFDIEILE